MQPICERLLLKPQRTLAKGQSVDTTLYNITYYSPGRDLKIAIMVWAYFNTQIFVALNNTFKDALLKRLELIDRVNSALRN